jgi:Flp pilus assembly protein TadD
MYPQFDAASENKFISVKSGIECERCHGPGSIHVSEKMAGIIVDTAREIDYSIVNPPDLPRDLQVELCQRCHLQGISVLNEGKTFFDFKPGMRLSEVMNVFMPRYEGNPNTFIMASHADRMKQSTCYTRSEMTCLTCHDPHVSVKVTPPERFNGACRSCHSPQHGHSRCTAPAELRKTENDDCYKCHMPVSETLDIPHVTVHDHRIQVPVPKSRQDSILKFVGLECMTVPKASALLMAKGYLQAFEAYSPQPFLLDSAEKYLAQVRKKTPELIQAKIRLTFLKEDYAGVISVMAGVRDQAGLDAWSNYRVGESFLRTGNHGQAQRFFRRAVEQEHLNPEFVNKLGATLLALNKIDSAEKILVRCMTANPKYAPAINNLGYCYLLQNDLTRSGILFDQALALDPDYESALMNKAQWFLMRGETKNAKALLERVLRLNPSNEKAAAALSQMRS